MLKTLGLFLLLQGSNGSTESVEHEGTATPWRYDYTKYHPMHEIYQWMGQLVTENPGVVSSSVYGLTYEGRNITFLKIGLQHPEGMIKKSIWMDCGIHAREWIAPAFCQWFVKEILQTYKTDMQINQLLQNLDFYVTPVLNIDGYVYSWLNKSTRLWRKSRSPPPEGCSCYGVDLNRNFNVNWGMIGVSFDCCHDNYCGTGAVSQMESQAVTEFVGSRTDEILCYLTIHSPGQLILLPYGHPQIQATHRYRPPTDTGHPQIQATNYDELVKVGKAAAELMKSVHGMNYRMGTSPQVLYPNSGSSRDWARLIGIPFSYTFELRDKGQFGHLLPEYQIQPVCEEAFVGALSIITYVHDKTFY